MEKKGGATGKMLFYIITLARCQANFEKIKTIYEVFEGRLGEFKTMASLKLALCTLCALNLLFKLEK
jgi:hypothetical protein